MHQRSVEENKKLRTEMFELKRKNERLERVVAMLRNARDDLKNLGAKMDQMLERAHVPPTNPVHPDGTPYENPHSPDSSLRLRVRKEANGSVVLKDFKSEDEAAYALARRKSAPPAEGELQHRAGAVKMLKMLATFYPGAMTKPQIARAAKMKVTGGTFGTYWSGLKRDGLFEESDGGFFRITDAGLAFLGEGRPEQPKTLEDRIAFWAERLRAGERDILQVVIKHGLIPRDDIAAEVNMAPGGGTFGTYLSTLTNNKLIAKDSSGAYFLHEWLKKGAEG